jgi:hypothetical protein
MNIVELYTKLTFCYGCGQLVEPSKAYVKMVRNKDNSIATHLVGHKRCL